MEHFVVVGAGQAGQSLCAKLRALGFEGRITLIGEETAPPYQRPPLSKAYLLGDMPLERLYLRPLEFYDDQKIELRLGAPVSAIDPAAKTITIGDDVVAYDKLALTTGSIPRQLPAAIGGTLDGVFTVRTLADVDAMAPEFQKGRRVLIIGGGYIGLEAAAVAAKRGLDVTLVEMADRILQRVASEDTSAYFADLHARHGVKILTGVGLQQLNGQSHVAGATLTDGTELDADFVIVGVGIAPAQGLAEAAGLSIENGIKVDRFSCTSDPSIFSAGDCASFPAGGAKMRLESVGNAIDQAENAAANMLGHDVEYVPKPWFWSDQYDVKLQIAGLGAGHDETVTRPTDEAGAQSIWYFKGDQLMAVDAMNDPRAYMVGKRLIEAGLTAPKAAISDPSFELKALLKR